MLPATQKPSAASIENPSAETKKVSTPESSAPNITSSNTSWLKSHARTILFSLLALLAIGLVLITYSSFQPQSQLSLSITGARDKVEDKALSLTHLKQNQPAPDASNITTPETDPQPQSQPSPSPSIIPLSPGVGVYNISQGKHAGPTIRQVIFDPLDAKQDQTLTITLKVQADTPAQTITGTLQTDTSTEKLTFTKTETTNLETWQAKIDLPSTVLYKYILTIQANSPESNTQITVAPRS